MNILSTAQWLVNDIIASYYLNLLTNLLKQYLSNLVNKFINTL